MDKQPRKLPEEDKQLLKRAEKILEDGLQEAKNIKHALRNESRKFSKHQPVGRNGVTAALVCVGLLGAGLWVDKVLNERRAKENSKSHSL